MRGWYRGCAPAFQAEKMGSSPIPRSTSLLKLKGLKMIKSVFAAMAAVALVACAQPSSEEVVDQPQVTPVETPAPELVGTPPEDAVKIP